MTRQGSKPEKKKGFISLKHRRVCLKDPRSNCSVVFIKRQITGREFQYFRSFPPSSHPTINRPKSMYHGRSTLQLLLNLMQSAISRLHEDCCSIPAALNTVSELCIINFCNLQCIDINMANLSAKWSTKNH